MSKVYVVIDYLDLELVGVWSNEKDAIVGMYEYMVDNLRHSFEQIKIDECDVL